MSRNKIVSNFNCLVTSRQLANVEILPILDLVLKLKLDLPNEVKVEIQPEGLSLSSFNWSVKNMTLLWSIVHRLKYLKLGSDIIKDYPIVEYVNNQKIIRNFQTFHQNCDHVRYKLYSVISNIIPIRNSYKSSILILLGGECYIYPEIIHGYRSCYIFSDYSSIINDANNNTSIIRDMQSVDKYIYIKHISYSQVDKTFYEYLPDIRSINQLSYMVVNVRSINSKLANELILFKPDVLAIVSCNTKNMSKIYNEYLSCYYYQDKCVLIGNIQLYIFNTV